MNRLQSLMCRGCTHSLADCVKQKIHMCIANVQGKLWVDVGLWGGITPDNARNASVLLGMLDAGALGFKSFMSPSGAWNSLAMVLLPRGMACVYINHAGSATRHMLSGPCICKACM